MPKKHLNGAENDALRRCALLCWKQRAQLSLSEADREQVLIAVMAVGTTEEGEAAAGIVAAMRETDERQLKLDQILAG